MPILIPPCTESALLSRIIRIHFDPDGGSRYWLEREAELGINARADIRSVSDLTGIVHTNTITQVPQIHAKIAAKVTPNLPNLII